MRKIKSFTISSDILAELENSKGTGSTSERVNRLLKRALELERRERLEQEAAEFFATAANDIRERREYQKASTKTLSRD